MTHLSKGGLRLQSNSPAPVLPTIALCMIVRDEAATIADAIKSAYGLVREVVVCDTGSTDDTIAIAKGLGAKVVNFPWRDDFAAARNFAVEHCRSDWILVLDADETLKHFDGEAADALYGRLARERAIYTLMVDNMTHSGVTRHETPRLFPNQPQFRYAGKIHEVPVDNLDGTRQRLLTGFEIVHNGYLPHVVEAKGKHERNRRMLSAETAAHPNSPTTRAYFAEALHAAGDLATAVDQARVAIWLANLHPDGQCTLEQAAVNLVGALCRSDFNLQAIAEAKAVLDLVDVVHPAFWCALGNAYCATEQPELALASYQRALAWKGTPARGSVAVGCTTWMPYAGIGLALYHLGRVDEALICLDRALAIGCDVQQNEIATTRAEIAAERQQEATP